jgi:hypothetical protein
VFSLFVLFLVDSPPHHHHHHHRAVPMSYALLSPTPSQCDSYCLRPSFSPE